MLERPGEIVTREELRFKLWPENTFVDFDVGLNTAIKRLREALADSADNSHYIETVPRRGYRFTVHVEPIPESPPASVAVPDNGSSTAQKPLGHRRVWVLIASIAAITISVVLLNMDQVLRLFHWGPATSVHSLAVLPLENLSGDPGQDYFADGMTDALTTRLGRIGQLRVVSRTSTNRYKNTRESLQQIARELNVDALVEGTVARSGDRVRITANLIQVAPEKHLWADSFEANLRDVLALQDDTSRAIANAIQLELTPQEKARLNGVHSIDPRAYDAYLQGRYFSEKTLPAGDGKKPAEYYQLAMSYAPDWALPYTGLAEIYLLEGSNLAIPNDSCTQAKNLSFEALKRDSESAEAHAMLADVEYRCEWNWAGAEREAARAIEINPSLAEAHSFRGRYLLTLGRTAESLRETQQAVELDPLAFRIRMDRWSSLNLTGQYAEALEQCQKIKELDPAQSLAFLYCGEAYIQEGKFTQAVQEHEKALSLSNGKNPRAIAYLAYAYAVAGRRKDARDQLANLILTSKERHVHPYLIAVAYAGLGEDDLSLDCLAKAYNVRARDLLTLRYDPVFAKMRTHPRFIDLLQRIGFPA